MVGSMHTNRYAGWSKFNDDAFGEIAMRMDTTSTVRLTACSKELHLQVVGGKGSRCPNNGCGTLVAFQDFLNHNMECPHDPCNCTEPGCEFATLPTTLLAHLEKSHSMEVQSFHYGEEHRYISQPLLAPRSFRVEKIGSGDDGTVFVVLFDVRDSGDIGISFMCVRSDSCLSPLYNVLITAYYLIVELGFWTGAICSSSMPGSWVVPGII